MYMIHNEQERRVMAIVTLFCPGHKSRVGVHSFLLPCSPCSLQVCSVDRASLPSGLM